MSKKGDFQAKRKLNITPRVKTSLVYGFKIFNCDAPTRKMAATSEERAKVSISEPFPPGFFGRWRTRDPARRTVNTNTQNWQIYAQSICIKAQICIARCWFFNFRSQPTQFIYIFQLLRGRYYLTLFCFFTCHPSPDGLALVNFTIVKYY